MCANKFQIANNVEKRNNSNNKTVLPAHITPHPKTKKTTTEKQIFRCVCVWSFLEDNFCTTTSTDCKKKFNHDKKNQEKNCII